jgi:Kdo2-lipid IVA lauroyltransferase/acyltransferase
VSVDETATVIPAIEHFKAAVIRGLYRLLACLPLRVIQLLGSVLGKLFWATNSRMAKTTIANIRLCFPELSSSEQTILAQESLMETGKTILETGACWNWSLEKCRAFIHRIDGEELFAERCADPRGLILLMPHLCTWEILHPVLTSHTHFTAMYKPPKIRPLDDWMQAVRNRSSATMVPANRRGVTELVKTLKAGGCIVMLPDQEPERESGDFAPFFGVETLTVSLVHGLATKTNAQLLLVNAKRLRDGSGFDVVFRDANAVNTDNLSESLAAMNAIIERAVREIPAQYQWEYKRFKRRPQGKADFY